MADHTILSTDYYVALYEDGQLRNQAKPCYLDAHTLMTIFPDAEYYDVPEDVYEAMEDDGYPQFLRDFPLQSCVRYR